MGSNLKYVYPVFDGINLVVIRIGGSGLGNLLYPYFRALIYANKYNLKLIDPVFKSIKPSLLLKSKQHRRLYNYTITNSIKGLDRFLILLKKREGEFENSNAEIKCFKGFYNGFKPFYGYEVFLLSQLKSLVKHKEINLEKFQNNICCHIRLGDFKKHHGDRNIKNNTRLPIEWYISALEFLMKKNKGIKVYVFSDGNQNELKNILDIPDVKFEISNDPIVDLLKMSQGKYFIGSYSSFSMWASFFSSGTTIWNKNIFNKREFPQNSETILY